MGVVSDVVADDELMAAARRVAEVVAAAPRGSLMRTKAKAIAAGGSRRGSRRSTSDYSKRWRARSSTRATKAAASERRSMPSLASRFET